MTIRRAFSFCLIAALLTAACTKQPQPQPQSQPEQISGITTSTDGIPIQYDSTGAGDVALVFIHCWTCNRTFWDNETAYFSRHYQVVRLDLAGHGESGLGRKDYTMPLFGEDVAAVVNALNLERVILIGFSMGGPVAMEAQRILGKRVVGIVGVDTFYTGVSYPAGAKIAEFIQPFDVDFPGTTEKMVRSRFTTASDRVLVERLVKHFTSSNKEVAVSALKNVLIWFERDSAAALDRAGNRLRNINANPQGTAKPLHPSVTLIPGVGHFIAQEKPAAFHRALETALQQLE